MKGLICIVGESFRTGGQGSRKRDLSESYEPQKSAALSVVEFMDHLKSSRGVECDVFMSSYATRWEADLKGWYGRRLIGCNMIKNLVGLENLVAEAKKKVNFALYDFVLVLRVDLFLKPLFKSVFEPNWDKIMYPSICWLGGHHTGGQPRASDMMVFIPKRLASAPFYMSHGACRQHAEEGRGSEFGFMLDTFHDSDSAKDYNPIYRLVGRHASDKWHSMGNTVGEGFAPVLSGIRKFSDWTPRSMLRLEKRRVDVESMWEWWHRPHDASFFRFVDLIKFATHNSRGNIVEHYVHPHQRYWELKGDEMVILDENRRVSSRLKKISEDVYSGRFEFNDAVTFLIRKADPGVWSC